MRKWILAAFVGGGLVVTGCDYGGNGYEAEEEIGLDENVGTGGSGFGEEQEGGIFEEEEGVIGEEEGGIAE